MLLSVLTVPLLWLLGSQLLQLLTPQRRLRAERLRLICGRLAALGIPAFGCTPDQFPDLMAAAIERQDIATWAARNDIVTVRSSAGG